MKKSYSVAFVSNYINHHQIPFCNAMSGLTEGRFTFVQTQPMEEERVRMGWHEKERPGYVRCFYEEEAFCRELILNCDMVIFGGTDDESYIAPRLNAGKAVLRYSERLYKTGQWKAVSPRGLKKKYHDHTRYRNAPVYLLCAGAYVASDFQLIRAYQGKRYCWGYFPETRHYDIDRLLEQKGYGEEKLPLLVWAGRMIDWKHPEAAVETAKYLRDQGLKFHMDMVGGGEMYPQVEESVRGHGLEPWVTVRGFQPPEAVRESMEKADICLFTSDRQEGWGAVANEAMNSGCALVADHLIGAVPFLIRDGENGFIYKDGKKRQLFELTERLVRDREISRQAGRKAYETIVGAWNAEYAAERLMELIRRILEGKNGVCAGAADGSGRKNDDFDTSNRMDYVPCAPAPVLRERYAGGGDR